MMLFYTKHSLHLVFQQKSSSVPLITYWHRYVVAVDFHMVPCTAWLIEPNEIKFIKLIPIINKFAAGFSDV